MPSRRYKPEQIVTLLRQIEGDSEREDHSAGLLGSADHRADLLPLEKRVRRAEVGSSKADEGVGAREREIETRNLHVLVAFPAALLAGKFR